MSLVLPTVNPEPLAALKIWSYVPVGIWLSSREFESSLSVAVVCCFEVKLKEFKASKGTNHCIW